MSLKEGVSPLSEKQGPRGPLLKKKSIFFGAGANLRALLLLCTLAVSNCGHRGEKLSFLFSGDCVYLTTICRQ